MDRYVILRCILFLLGMLLVLLELEHLLGWYLRTLYVRDDLLES